MESHTLLMVGFVVLAAAAFVTARAGAVAIGVLPATTGAPNGDARDGNTGAEPNEDQGMSPARDDTEGGRASRITADDRERMRTHLEKDPLRRSPDDLLPPDADDGS